MLDSNIYIYGHSQSYTVRDGKVSLSDPTLPVTRKEGAENSRTMCMIVPLVWRQ